MKKISFVYFIFVIVFFNCSYAQQWLWVKASGGSSYDYAHAVCHDLDGNVFVTGSYEGTGTFGTTQLTNSGQKDVFIVKYNNQGDVLWAKKAGGSGTEEGLSIAVDESGDCYITGFFTGTIYFSQTVNYTSSNGKDIFLAKYDGSNGNLVWAKKVGVSGDAEGSGVALDDGGNIYITGYFRNTASFKTTQPTISLTAAGGLDAYVAKFNSNGICQWARKGGGSLLDRSYGIDVRGSNIVITGYYEGTGTFGTTQLISAGSGDAFVAKYNTDGNLSWAKSFGGNNTDYGHTAVLDTLGNVFVAGRFEVQATFLGTSLTSNGGYDIFLTKLNASGNLAWVKNFGGPYIDYAKKIVMNKYYNALFLTGAYAVEAEFDNVSLSSPTNSQDVFVVKTDTTGGVIWAADGGGLYDDEGNGLAVDTFGVVYVAGSFYNNAGVFGNVNVTGFAEYDAFTGKICPLSAQVVKNDLSCPGINDGSIAIFPDGGSPPFTYEWLPNVSDTSTADTLSAGIYNITVTDVGGCEVNVQVEIEEPDTMAVNVTAHQISCHDANDGWATVVVTGGTLPYDFAWNTTPVQNNDTVFSLSEGIYKVLITDAGGCKDSAEAVVINPPLLEAFAGQNISVCTGNNVDLGANPSATGGTGAYSYAWSPTIYLNNSSIPNPVATPLSATTYTLTVSDANFCTATASVSISITQPPAVMISQSDSICVGETTNLAANAANAQGYSWAPAASLNNSNIQTPVASPIATTTYTVTVNFPANCYNTASVIIVVYPLPIVNTIGNQSICEGDSIELWANGGQSYQWQPSQWLYNSNLSNPQTYPLNTDVIFNVNVTDSNSCSNSATLTVTVNPVPTPVIVENNGVLSSNYAVGNQWYHNGVPIANANGQNFTPTLNGDYTVEVNINNCAAFSDPFSVVNVGIIQNNSNDVLIYPNPTVGIINMVFPIFNSSDAKCIIKDLAGKIVFTTNINHNEKSSTLNLKTLQSGIYFLEIISDDFIIIKKIIIYK